MEKEEMVKSIRFSKEEFYMLDCCKATNKKFSAFIKELINDYIKRQNTISSNNDIDIDLLKREIKAELKNELLHELRKEVPEKIEEEAKEEIKVDDPKKEEAKKALFNLLGR